MTVFGPCWPQGDLPRRVRVASGRQRHFVDGGRAFFFEGTTMRRLMTIGLVVLAIASAAGAQTNPLTLPLADLSAVRAAGSWTFDWPDGAGGDLSYGPGAIGVSEDGKSVYLGCNLVTLGGVAKLTIPALGGRAVPVRQQPRRRADPVAAVAAPR